MRFNSVSEILCKAIGKADRLIRAEELVLLGSRVATGYGLVLLRSLLLNNECTSSVPSSNLSLLYNYVFVFSFIEFSVVSPAIAIIFGEVNFN